MSWLTSIFIAVSVIAIYSIFSLFRKTQISRKFKLLGTLLIIAASLKWQWLSFLGGNLWRPDIPYWQWEIIQVAFNSVISLFLLLFIYDIVQVVIRLIWRKNRKISGFDWQQFKLCMIPALAICVGIYGTWEALRVPDIRKVSIEILDLPPAIEGFKIIQLSDTHIQSDTPDEWVEGVMKKVNAQKPDMIVLTGDIADGQPREMENKIKPFSQFKSVYGVYGVSGNHELYWSYASWMLLLEKMGIHMLENREIILDVQGNSVKIFGLKDQGHISKQMKPDIPPVASKVKSGITIGLIHQPLAASFAKDRADLILSGHTHGGHMFPVSLIVKHFNGDMVSGLYDNIYVSNGTALWRGFPFRLGVPAEITELTLISK